MSNEREAATRTRIPPTLSWHGLFAQIPGGKAVLDRMHAHVRDNPERYVHLQESLDEANANTTYDRYLTRTVHDMLLVGIGSTVICVLALVGWLAAGGLSGMIAEFGVFPTLVAIAMGSLLAGIVLGGITGVGRYYYPRLRARQRRRRIDATLPHAILFLYALTHGGSDLSDAVDQLADAQNVYGEVAVEFDRLRTELRWFDTNLFTGLSRARDRTPSESLEVFFEEWENVLETGGDVEGFFETQVESQLERAEERQEQLLEDIETIAEAYIVLIFAAPIFMFIILTVMSFVNPVALTFLDILVYGYIPLGLAGFILAFGSLVGTIRHGHGSITFGARPIGTGVWSVQSLLSRDEDVDPRLRAYRTVQRRLEFRTMLSNLVTRLERRPRLVLVVTIPLSLVVLAGVVLGAPAEWTGFGAHPIRATTGLVIAPLLVTTIPLSLLHELNQRRIRNIRERFPAALRIIADANRNDVPLVECFSVVSERTTGELAEELRRVRHDIDWTHDIDTALKTFADRLDVPPVSRSINVLAAGLRMTHAVAPVVDVLADDLDTRNRLKRQRREGMQSYVAVVFIGALVYLTIAGMFNVAFFPVIKRFAEQPTAIQRSPLRLGTVPVTEYQQLLYHSALLQAFGNGLVLGKLTSDRVLSGLKYANALLVITVVVFLALSG